MRGPESQEPRSPFGGPGFLGWALGGLFLGDSGPGGVGLTALVPLGIPANRGGGCHAHDRMADHWSDWHRSGGDEGEHVILGY